MKDALMIAAVELAQTRATHELFGDVPYITVSGKDGYFVMMNERWGIEPGEFAELADTAERLQEEATKQIRAQLAEYEKEMSEEELEAFEYYASELDY